MRPVEIVHPITGQRCFTKHPEKLLARCRAQEIDGTLLGRPEHLISGFEIAVVNTWTFPRTEWRHGALKDKPVVPDDGPVDKRSAYDKACEQLGL